MRVVGWVSASVGMLWATMGAENILNSIARAWHFHQWKPASQAIRDNGTFFELPGMVAAIVGAVVILHATA